MKYARAEKDDGYTGKTEISLPMKEHKPDEILTEYGDRKFEKQEIGSTEEKHFKIYDNSKLMHKELDIKRKLS